MGTHKELDDLLFLFEATKKKKKKGKRLKDGRFPKNNRIRQPKHNPYSYHHSRGKGPRGMEDSAIDDWTCKRVSPYLQICTSRSTKRTKKVPVNPSWKAEYNREYWQWLKAKFGSKRRLERKPKTEKPAAVAAAMGEDLIWGRLVAQRKDQHNTHWLGSLEEHYRKLRTTYGIKPGQPIPQRVWSRVEADIEQLVGKAAKGALTLNENARLRHLAACTAAEILTGYDVDFQTRKQTLAAVQDLLS